MDEDHSKTEAHLRRQLYEHSNTFAISWSCALQKSFFESMPATNCHWLPQLNRLASCKKFTKQRVNVCVAALFLTLTLSWRQLKGVTGSAGVWFNRTENVSPRFLQLHNKTVGDSPNIKWIHCQIGALRIHERCSITMIDLSFGAAKSRFCFRNRIVEMNSCE